MMNERNRVKGAWLIVAVAGVLSACLSSMPAAASNGIKYTYDALGRVKQVQRDFTYTYAYIDDTNTVTHTDERGNVATYAYDSFGDPEDKLLTEVNNTTGSTFYTYNAAGKLASVQMSDAANGGIKRSFTYDPKQFLQSETLPEMNPISGKTASVWYAYDPAGKMLSRQDARGVTSYAYDGVNRVTDITYPSGTPSVHYIYNRDGTVKSMASDNVTTYTYAYAPDQKLLSKSYTIDAKAYVVSFGYNDLRNIRSITYPNGGQAIYGYYPDQVRVASVRYANTQAIPPLDRVLATNITYDATGQITGMTQGNGVRTSLAYDTNCRLKSIIAPDVINMEYLYDGCDNVLSIADNIKPANTITVGASGYDILNRLVSAAGPWGSLSFTYDYSGNRRTMTTNSSPTTYTYDAFNRLSATTGIAARTFSHDGSGNMTCNGVFTFAYDNANRMVTSSDGAAYTYDGEGHRIKKARGGDSWVYHYGLGNTIISETTMGGRSLVDYIFLGDKAIAKYTW